MRSLTGAGALTPHRRLLVLLLRTSSMKVYLLCSYGAIRPLVFGMSGGVNMPFHSCFHSLTLPLEAHSYPGRAKRSLYKAVQPTERDMGFDATSIQFIHFSMANCSLLLDRPETDTGDNLRLPVYGHGRKSSRLIELLRLWSIGRSLL